MRGWSVGRGKHSRHGDRPAARLRRSECIIDRNAELALIDRWFDCFNKLFRAQLLVVRSKWPEFYIDWLNEFRTITNDVAKLCIGHGIAPDTLVITSRSMPAVMAARGPIGLPTIALDDCANVVKTLELTIEAKGDGVASGTNPTPAKTKPRGRKKADYETQQREAQLAADWKQAKEAGTYKADFAKKCGLTQATLDALLDRVAKRKSASE